MLLFTQSTYSIAANSNSIDISPLPKKAKSRGSLVVHRRVAKETGGGLWGRERVVKYYYTVSNKYVGK